MATTTRTLNSIINTINDVVDLNDTEADDLAAAILDNLGIAYDKDDSSTLVDSINGTFGLANGLSASTGHRITFVTGTEDEDRIEAHVLNDGQLEVRAQAGFRGLALRPRHLNEVRIAVEQSR